MGTNDNSLPCFAYGGPLDPCSLNNNNDPNDGLDKDPSLCTMDTFYLWDEPDTQGRDYQWAGQAWLEYANRWSHELSILRSRDTLVTSPLLKAGSPGVLEANLATFMSACGSDCSNPGHPAYIDIIAINAFCGPWNKGGCRSGALYILNEAKQLSSAFENKPVYITNWSRLETSSPVDQIDAIDSLDAFFTQPVIVKRVYWFGATDYGGNSGQTAYLTNMLPDGRTLGDILKAKCDSLDASSPTRYPSMTPSFR